MFVAAIAADERGGACVFALEPQPSVMADNMNL